MWVNERQANPYSSDKDPLRVELLFISKLIVPKPLFLFLFLSEIRAMGKYDQAF